MRMAISLASEPVTAKFTTLRSPGAFSASRSANAMVHGLEYHDDWCTKLPAISRITSVSSGCEWPSTMHIMPDARS
jgi:hypothetical protein